MYTCDNREKGLVIHENVYYQAMIKLWNQSILVNFSESESELSSFGTLSTQKFVFSTPLNSFTLYFLCIFHHKQACY